jgi:hypothetical protein
MTMARGPLSDARDMFAVHTMFRREYGSMPDLVRAVAAGDKQRAAVVADHICNGASPRRSRRSSA